MQIALKHCGINLDMFMPDKEDYYRQLVIRTGSAEYVHHLIAAGWKRNGWCGSDKGLRRISDCLEKKGPDGKSTWKCMNLNGRKPPIWESEEDFFNWLHVPFTEPQYRYYANKLERN